MSAHESPIDAPPARPRPWQLFTAFNTPGPRWPSALRAGLSMALPSTIALALGLHVELLLIAAGSFTVIYGEGYAYRARWKVLLIAGAFFASGAMAGAFVGTVVWGQIYAGGSSWWLMITVAFTTTIAGVGVYIANALRLPPPGPWFILLVAGASTMTYRLGLNPVEVAAWSLLGVASSVVVGMTPALFFPRGPEEQALKVLEHTVANLEQSPPGSPVPFALIHQAQAALNHTWFTLVDAGVIHAGRIKDLRRRGLVDRTLHAQAILARAHSGEYSPANDLTDTVSYIDPSRLRIPHARPSISYRLYRSVHSYSHASMTAIRVVIACLGAGLASILLGLDRPDWAIISALLILMWGPERIPGTIRGLHRLLGSILGIGLYMVFYALELDGWALMLAISACLFFSEIFVGRNYAFAVIFTTPIALMLGGAMELSAAQTAIDRTIEILLSVVFALGALWLYKPNAEPFHHSRLQHRCRRAMGALLGTLLTYIPDQALELRRDLQYELLSERRAAQSLAANSPQLAQQRWSDHLSLQRVGYAILDHCEAHPDQQPSLTEITTLAKGIQSTES
ncbi:FUSC family protein [Corynebacterium alimapuense]|uniref:FUSC family protein n=1 Tax=Corynebacterium alimapuense TaxID=1576874 RepID=A0A3M8K904_9CORY|nr:FUSC family protein [Corynebacterium alimapuense]RNE49616.1 FUSC family protein [Corynebacterium alimapuense]